MAESARFIFSKGIPKQIGPIIVNAFLAEDHTRRSSTTTYPVEDGADISDHIRNEPLNINIRGMIEAVGDGTNILESFNSLNYLMDSKTLFSVITGLKVYENMHMNSLNINRTVLNGGSLPFSARFSQITKVQSQAVAIAISQISTADEETNKQAQPSTDLGKTTSGQTQGENPEDGTCYLCEIKSQVDDILGDVEEWE
jgi:hypothetical protein